MDRWPFSARLGLLVMCPFCVSFVSSNQMERLEETCYINPPYFKVSDAPQVIAREPKALKPALDRFPISV